MGIRRSCNGSCLKSGNLISPLTLNPYVNINPNPKDLTWHLSLAAGGRGSEDCGLQDQRLHPGAGDAPPGQHPHPATTYLDVQTRREVRRLETGDKGWGQVQGDLALHRSRDREDRKVQREGRSVWADSSMVSGHDHSQYNAQGKIGGDSPLRSVTAST